MAKVILTLPRQNGLGCLYDRRARNLEEQDVANRSFVQLAVSKAVWSDVLKNRSDPSKKGCWLCMCRTRRFYCDGRFREGATAFLMRSFTEGIHSRDLIAIVEARH